MNRAEIEEGILKATEELAAQYSVYYDVRTEEMILNAMREVVLQYKNQDGITKESNKLKTYK